MPEDELWNDPGIADSEVLFRRLHATQLITDAGTGLQRLTSSVLSGHQDGISVYSATLLKQHGFAIEDILTTRKHGYAEFTVGLARDLGYGVIPDFNDEPPINVAHMLIKPPIEHLSRSQLRDLRLKFIGGMTIVRYPVL